jgi:hypothetical protein
MMTPTSTGATNALESSASASARLVAVVAELVPELSLFPRPVEPSAVALVDAAFVPAEVGLEVSCASLVLP